MAEWDHRALLAGVVGFFVVLRAASFAAHAIPNGAFAGAAGANLVGLNPLFGLISFAIVAALSIGVTSRRSRSDVATALSLVLMLALGAAFLTLSTEYEPAINALLFGEILGVSSSQLLPVLLLAVLCVAAILVLYRPLVFTSVAPDLAAAKGVNATFVEISFLLVLALATALTVPIVGALLTFALMIGPPAAARLLSKHPPGRSPCRSRWRSPLCGRRLPVRMSSTCRLASSWVPWARCSTSARGWSTPAGPHRHVA